MQAGSSNVLVRPYISKRKRKAEEQFKIKGLKRPFQSTPEMKNVFLTNEIIYRSSMKPTHNNFAPSCVSRTIPVSTSPLWSVKWCKKFSHLIACTAGEYIKLLDIFKEKDPCVWSSIEGESQIRDIDWSCNSRQLAMCSFSKCVKIWDFFGTDKLSYSIDTPEIPTIVRWWPGEENLIIVGGENSFLSTYDIRMGKVVITYPSLCGNLLSLGILTGTGSFIAAGDAVNEESAAHSLIAWDFASGAKLSGQIFHEKYTCPNVCVHPSESAFLAQTNGNYIARFKSIKPYHLDKCLRYDKHKVGGFPIGMDISPDGRIVASGSSDGHAVFYQYKDSSLLGYVDSSRGQYPPENGSAIVSLQYHPILSSMVALGDWSGKLSLLK